MKPKTNILLLLLVIFGGGILFVLMIRNDTKKSRKERQQYFDQTRLRQVALEQLADKLTSCPDTSYFIRYRTKPSGYFIYPVRADSVEQPSGKSIQAECLTDAIYLFEQIQIHSILNNRNDSFYRFRFHNKGRYEISNMEAYVSKRPPALQPKFPARLRIQKVSERVYFTYSAEK